MKITGGNKKVPQTLFHYYPYLKNRFNLFDPALLATLPFKILQKRMTLQNVLKVEEGMLFESLFAGVTKVFFLSF